MEKRDGEHVISGECRVEAISPTGQAFLLDGLRLRLDLQLKARSDTAPGLGHATLRFETDRLQALVARTPAYQRWAVLAGVAALGLASSIWVWGGAAKPAETLDGTGPSALPVLTTPSRRAHAPPEEERPPLQQTAVPDAASAGTTPASPTALRQESPPAREGMSLPARVQTAEAALRPVAPAASQLAPAASRHASAVTARPQGARATAGEPRGTSSPENANGAGSSRASTPMISDNALVELFGDTK
jgi:hypothetical protein